MSIIPQISIIPQMNLFDGSNNAAIYAIVQVSTGLVYVGSSGNIRIRWKAHKSQLRHNKHPNSRLQRTWNKYGEKDFIFRVLTYVPNKDDLFLTEQKFIDKYKAFNEKHGFNTSPVAGSQRGMPRTQETKDKISRSNKGKYYGVRLFTDAQALEIKQRIAAGERKMDIAKAYGVPRHNIYHIACGATYSWVTVPAEIQDAMECHSGNQYGSNHHNSKLCEESVRQIRKMFTVGHSNEEIGNLFNVNRGTILHIKLGKTWGHVK